MNFSISGLSIVLYNQYSHFIDVRKNSFWLDRVFAKYSSFSFFRNQYCSAIDVKFSYFSWFLSRVYTSGDIQSQRFVASSSYNFTDVIFDHCSSTNQGGAIFCDNLLINGHIQFCVFRDCNAPEQGGGLFVNRGGNHTLFNTEFYHCYSSKSTSFRFGIGSKTLKTVNIDQISDMFGYTGFGPCYCAYNGSISNYNQTYLSSSWWGLFQLCAIEKNTHYLCKFIQIAHSRGKSCLAVYQDPPNLVSPYYFDIFNFVNCTAEYLFYYESTTSNHQIFQFNFVNMIGFTKHGSYDNWHDCYIIGNANITYTYSWDVLTVLNNPFYVLSQNVYTSTEVNSFIHIPKILSMRYQLLIVLFLVI